MPAEKFTEADLSNLREELQERITGPFELAEILRAFLMNRGYGASPDSALAAASKVGSAGFSFSTIQQQLESLALVM